MDKQLNDIDLVERFLEGSLSDNELDAFDQRLKTDTTLAGILAQRKLLQASYFEASERHDLKKQIRLAVNDEKRKMSNLKRNAWLIAASFTILAGIGTFFIMQSRQSSDNNLVSQGNNSQEDEVVAAKQNKIAEYGSVDTFNKQSKINVIDFLPVDGTVFNQKDTILFFLPVMNEKDVLIIYDNAGSVIKKVSFQPGNEEYKILPYTLKPGEYAWNHLLDQSKKHYFSIK